MKALVAETTPQPVHVCGAATPRDIDITSSPRFSRKKGKNQNPLGHDQFALPQPENTSQLVMTMSIYLTAFKACLTLFEHYYCDIMAEFFFVFIFV